MRELIEATNLAKVKGFGDVYCARNFIAAHDRMAEPALDGFATLYLKPHVYQGRIEVMYPGCFSNTLKSASPVAFLIEHNRPNVVATTSDNLTLVDRDDGLAFRLRVPKTLQGVVAA